MLVYFLNKVIRILYLSGRFIDNKAYFSNSGFLIEEAV